MQNEDKSKKAERMRKRAELWIVFLHFLAAMVLGLSLFPMVLFLRWVWVAMSAEPLWLKVLAFSFSISFGYFLFGTTLIFLCVFVKNIFRFKITPGLYTMHSDQAIHWAGYNSLILIANSAFLDIFRVSPYQNLFYKLMGAKIGTGVNVNTGGLADLSLLEIGDNVVIGGGVALICHGFERGFLRLESTKIGNNVSIGLSSVIMPGCEIGDGASIGPCTYLPKGSVVPPKAVWGGNPARDLRAERRAALADEG
jgi:acetyltransferase-like isoleucine patch superfamily enzyme